MTHGSLFSGIGGFDLAAQQAGFENIFNCEIIEYNRKILKKNFPNAKQYEDITKFDAREYKDKIDVLSGGFPCQDVSCANTHNRQGIRGGRTGLWKEYARVVGEISPKYIIFENSPMLLVSGFEQVLCDLYKLRYDVEWRCFYASDFGFPHYRKRLYGVAYSNSERCSYNTKQDFILQKILPKRTQRPFIIPMYLKRFNSKSNYETVRMDDGFSKELDKELIHAYGNAIVVPIAKAIFEQIKVLNKNGVKIYKKKN